ncbi:unnamed protein product [Polarella glacialis]|uniref:Uncharacterized protein n=1 Tax=Polarella glacialis TaxID=89957 RepID=A0A813FGI8_POLGL|nr:unnamed protein product [Polarella glacialis]CAE8711520.1 unnamed protein product [Polarella glacialis]
MIAPRSLAPQSPHRESFQGQFQGAQTQKQQRATNPQDQVQHPAVAAVNAISALRPGDAIEVFYRMPHGLDNGEERIDIIGDRWLLCPTSVQGTNRPRIGWTDRWLPATVVESPMHGICEDPSARFRWELRHWYDWASGDHIESTTDPDALINAAPVSYIRPRSPGVWSIPRTPSWASNSVLPRCGTEIGAGGVEVAVSFIVFRWGAAKIPVKYDSHSWGRAEGSTVSSRFIELFFNGTVVPRLGWDYETLTVFIQHSDEFAGISPEFLASLCRGRTICALYFLWPIQGQQTYGDKIASAAAYVDAESFFQLVTRAEACGITTRWPHPVQLWRSLVSKDWVPNLCVAPRFHVPLTTRITKSLVLADPRKAARAAIAAIWLLQADRRSDGHAGPRNSDWVQGEAESSVVKLGFSYEGVDVKMAQGENCLAEALYSMMTQAGYTNDCVYVQQRVRNLHLEARCFVVGGKVVNVLYTRFGRVVNGFVRDYEKAHTADEAMREWFCDDKVAWDSAMEQIQVLSCRWYLWLLTQSAEPTVSVRMDYLLERVSPGKADVWTGEVGEQGYSMGGLDPLVVFNAVLDTVSDEVCQRQFAHGSRTKRPFRESY